MSLDLDKPSREQASQKIVIDFWNAAIEGKHHLVARLWRSLEGHSPHFLGYNQPIVLINVGKPFRQKGVFEGKPVLIVPCKVRFKNGQIEDKNMIVMFRDVSFENSCLIIGTWNKAR